jgi:hypothetical protein
MSFQTHSSPVNTEQLVRILFWTLLVTTVGLTAYGLLVELFGIGLFLRDQVAPKLHMRAEANLACALSSVSAIGLAIVCAFLDRWSRPLRRLGFVALAFWLFYLSFPRF